jgi:hypothetical protein
VFAASRLPIVRSLARLRRRPDGPSAALYLFLSLLLAVALALPLCRPLQRELLAAHHLRGRSAGSWALVQLVPKMYAFGHQAYLSEQRLTRFLLERPERIPFAHQSAWVNHYPARLIRFEGMRAEVAGRGATVHVLLRSRYRGTALQTRFEVTPEAGRLWIQEVE